jgi:hypothetical protein
MPLRKQDVDFPYESGAKLRFQRTAVCGLLLTLLHALLCAAASQPPEPGAQFDGETNSVRIEEGERFNLMPFTLAAWIWLDDDREPQVFFNRGSRAHLFTLYLIESRIVFVTDRAHDATVATTAKCPPLRTGRIWRRPTMGNIWFSPSMESRQRASLQRPSCRSIKETRRKRPCLSAPRPRA